LHYPQGDCKSRRVRISELSARTGVPVPTVKYYLREGLLPPGERTDVNQARYDEHHVDRLRLIRALVEVGGVSLDGVRSVLTALADPGFGVHDVLGIVQDAITPRSARPGTPEWAGARQEVAALVGDLGWDVRPGAPALDQLADLLVAVRTVTGTATTAAEYFGLAARIAADLADAEVRSVEGTDRETMARNLVAGTVLGGRALDALRRLAHEDASGRLFGDGTAHPGGDGTASRK
jgi:DNA-binding transcriptional MerR regulator